MNDEREIVSVRMNVQKNVKPLRSTAVAKVHSILEHGNANDAQSSANRILQQCKNSKLIISSRYVGTN